MADLPEGWARFTLGDAVPENRVVFNGYLIPVGQFNALSAGGMFTTLAAGAEDPTHIPNHVLQRLRNVDFGSFSGNVEENPTQWIQLPQNKLNQVECPQRFWRSEVAI
jgi:hypothetical protein